MVAASCPWVRGLLSGPAAAINQAVADCPWPAVPPLAAEMRLGKPPPPKSPPHTHTHKESQT